MQITRHTDSNLAGLIVDNLEHSRYRDYMHRMANDVLGKYVTYLWGGAVRDPIASARCGRKLELKDVDIVVDDSQGRINFRELLSGLGNICYNRFGSPKWKPEDGLEIDIMPFSNASNLRQGQKLPLSLDTALQSCDFTTGAIAYGLRDNAVYDYAALEGIDKGEVEVLYPEGEDAHVLMCRAVLQSEKLGFKLGPKITRLIVDGYCSGLDGPIKRYMDYKKVGDSFGHVIGQLMLIKAQSQPANRQ